MGNEFFVVLTVCIILLITVLVVLRLKKQAANSFIARISELENSRDEYAEDSHQLLLNLAIADEKRVVG